MMRQKESKDIENRLPKQRQARDPSGPRHMTTRRTASKPASVASRSVTGSISSNESRRNSLSEVTVKVGGSDGDADRPAKVARLSNDADQPPLATTADVDGQEENSPSQRDLAASNEEEGSDAESHDDNPSASQEPFYQDDSEAPKVSIEITKPDDDDDDDDNASEPDRANGNGRSVSPIEEAHEDADDLNGAEAASIVHDSGDNQSPEKQEPGGLLKRLPGRRRAPHADPGVEADLRRQLELKVAYRAVAKALKPLLAELAKRTAQDLEGNPEHHKEYEEYNQVMRELDERLQQRLGVLNYWRQEEEARLQRIREAGEEIVRNRFASKFRDLRDDRILECKHQFLSIIRDLEVEEDSDATEDEDGIIPRLYRIKYPEVVRTPLADAFDSRSRIFVQTGKLWNEFEHRHAFQEDQREFDADSLVIRPKDFAVYDGEQRTHAIASLNLNLLANAGKDVEDAVVRAKRQASNAAAVGLHALADASDMAVVPPSSNRKQTQDTSDAPETPRSNVKTTADFTPRSNGRVSPSPKKRNSGKSRQPVSRSSDVPQPALSTSPISQQITFPNPSISSRGSELRPLMPLAAKPFEVGADLAAARNPIQEGRSITPPQTEASKSGLSAQVEQQNDSGMPLHFPSPQSEQRWIFPMAQHNENATREDAAQGKPRKRPGPRAHYSTAEEPSPAIHQPVHDYWRPFNNSMGPPMFTPPYVGGGEHGRKASIPGAPLSPNVMLNAPDRDANHERNESAGAQIQPSTIRRESSGEHRPAGVPSNEHESHTATAPTPPSFLQPGHHSPFMKQWNPPQPFYQPNNYYGPFQGQVPGLPPPPYHSSRPPSSSGLHSASTFPPPSSYPFPGPPPPLRHNSIPSHPFQPLPPQFSPSPTTPGVPPPPPSTGQPYPPYPPPPTHTQHASNSMPQQPQINMKHPGQVGHTPILPATLDPNRNRPPSTTPTASSPPPFHPSGGGSMGVFSLYSPPTQNQETPLMPYEQHRPTGPREAREKHPSRHQEHIFYSMPSASAPVQSTTPVTLGHHHHRHHSQADAHGFVHHSPWARPSSRQNRRRGSASSGLTTGAKRDAREGGAAGRDTPGVSPSTSVGASRLIAGLPGSGEGAGASNGGDVQHYTQEQQSREQSRYESQEQVQSQWKPPPPPPTEQPQPQPPGQTQEQTPQS